jgi:hypothetical protein
VPAQAREFAGGRDDRDLHAAAGAHALEERAQRPRDPGRAPGGLHEHPTRVRATLLGDPPMRGGLISGLADSWVQAQIADQLPRTAEPPEVADRRHDRQRDSRIDAGNRHQALHVVTGQGYLAELRVDDLKFLAVKVELAQQRLDRLALIRRQLLLAKPRATLDPEQVRGRAARHEVSVQDRLNLVLQPRPLAHDVRPTSNLTAQRMGLLVGEPHPGQKVGRQQLRQHFRVDLVGLDLRLRDHARLLRIGHHHPRDPRLQQLRDRVRVARRLDRYLIRRHQAIREQPEALGRRRHPPGLAHQAVFPHRDLRELAVHIQAKAPALHCSPPSRNRRWESRRAQRHLRIRARSASRQVAGAANY